MYTLRSQLPALQSAFLRRISTHTGRQLSCEAMNGKLNELALPFAVGAPAAVMMLRLEGLLSDADEHHLPMYEFAVTNMAEETLGGHFHSGFFKNEFNYLVFTALPKRPFSTNGEGTALLERLADTLQRSVSQYLKGSISAVLSDFGRFPDDLPELYQQTLRMVQKLSGQEKETLIRLWDLPANPSFQCLQALHVPPALSQLYETGRTEDADEKLQTIFQEILQKGLDTQEHLLEVFFYLSHAFSYIVHRSGKHLTDVLKQKQGMNVDPRDFRSVKQLQEWAHAIHSSIVENTVPRKTTSPGNLVNQIHLYIEQHIADVSLQMLADHLSLHPAYISAMYKQETGENLSDHILRYRMEKSGYLVRNTRMKIYEIAAQLGYQHTPYFSKLFKNHYGVTPQDYRDRFHQV
jgi:two-component system response regulator YesN